MFLWIFPGQINRCAKNRRRMHFNDLECQWTKNGRYPWVSLFYSWLEPNIWLLVCILNSDWKEYQKISTAPALVLMLEKVRPGFVQGTLPITYSWSSCLSKMFSPLRFFFCLGLLLMMCFSEPFESSKALARPVSKSVSKS